MHSPAHKCAAVKKEWCVEEWVIWLAVTLRVGHPDVLLTLLDEAQAEPHLVLGAARALACKCIYVDRLRNLLFRTGAVAYLVQFARLEQQLEASGSCRSRLFLFLDLLCFDGRCSFRGRYFIQLELELLLIRFVCLDLFLIIIVIG